MSSSQSINPNSFIQCGLGKKIEIFIENSEKTKLEGIFGIGSLELDAPVILFLHPQPYSNGNMWNEVIQKMMNFAISLGFIVLAINFSGVGKSTGICDRTGHTAFQDAANAFKWLCTQRPYAKSRWVFGFSFGAYIGAQLTMRRPEVDHFIYFSVPFGIYDMSFFSPCPTKGIMVHAINDKIVSEFNILDFLVKNDKCKYVSYLRVDERTNHFFRNIDYDVTVFPQIYKFIKDNCAWPSFQKNKIYEENLKNCKYSECLKYSEYSNLLNTFPVVECQNEDKVRYSDILEDVM